MDQRYGALFTVNFDKLAKLVKGNSKTYLRNEIQSVHFQWLRNVLGVNKKKSSHLAILGEVGSYPLIIQICRNLGKHYARMIHISTDSLLYHSFQENKKMTENNCECWLGNMH